MRRLKLGNIALDGNTVVAQSKGYPDRPLSTASGSNTTFEAIMLRFRLRVSGRNGRTGKSWL